MFDRSREFEAIVKAYEQSGGDSSVFNNDKFGTLLVSGNKILFSNNIPGLHITGEELENGARAEIRVEKDVHIANPVHLCFGIVPEQGVQQIIGRFFIEENASVKFIAHCSFPNAVQVQHLMDGKVFVGKNAVMEYNETHFHGNDGGIEVLPDMEIEVDQGGRYISEFKLIKGAVGKMKLNYVTRLERNSVAELYAKVYGKKKDDIEVKESIYLEGDHSSGIAKSRIVVSDSAVSNVIGEVIGKGNHSRGHVDCTEIIRGNGARASAVPRLMVQNESAKLTHEAAIGSVDKKQIETLMARGLGEEDAIEVIVQGLLK